jgi:hypothetical protein
VGIRRLWQRSPSRFIAVGVLLTALGTRGHLALPQPAMVTHAATGCQLGSRCLRAARGN